MEEITDPDEKRKYGIPSDWKAHMERPARKGLSHTIYEPDDRLFNKEIRKHIRNEDFRYAATAIRYERNRLEEATWELIALKLDKSFKLPRKRPENVSFSDVDKRNREIKREYEELVLKGLPAAEINKLQLDKYNLSQSSITKARRAIPRVITNILERSNDR